MPAAANRKSFRLTGWHVFFMLCAFFGFMFIVNGIFLWAALSSFPGEDEDKSYLQGLHYNEAISARRVQEEQGWSAQIGLTPTETGDRLVVRLLERDGTALPAQDVEAQLRRTVTGSEDVPLDLQRSVDGDYFADISLLDKGVWEARVQASVPYGTDQVEFVASKKLIIP
ncbi:FixH family protein [uncultured Hyphomonas sp.]|uniref:FixH family protein n=1 Tax=uncultured Hyphomonas sp. TaxID=225298 RepID=UPI002AAA94F8|nr:FixH family protein [uncultured Hyphomonas sp.]